MIGCALYESIMPHGSDQRRKPGVGYEASFFTSRWKRNVALGKGVGCCLMIPPDLMTGLRYMIPLRH